MSAPPLYIKTLSIHKMPGFPRGLKPYEGLSRGINIIAGPNASGKSSTAQLIQQLFKEEGSRGYQAEATFQIEGEEWWIRNDEGRIEVQRGGQEAHLGAIPGQEQRKRYMLAFHELIQQEDGELAGVVAKQAIGGYDLEDAKEALGFGDKIKSKRTKPFDNYKKAKEHRESLQEGQAEIQKEEGRLEELKTQQEEAQKSGQRQEFYRLARDLKEAESEYESSKEALDQFPGIMEKVREGDMETVEGLEEEIGEAERKLNEARNQKQEAQEALQKLTLPEEGIPSEVLDELDQKVENLKELQRGTHELEKGIEGSSAQAQEALDRIGEGIDASQWEGITLEISGELDRFLQETHQTLSEKRFLEVEKEALENELPTEESAHTSRDLESGIGHLSNWLKEVQSSYGIPFKWIGVLGIIGAVFLLMTLLPLVLNREIIGWIVVPIGLVSIAGVVYFAYQKVPNKEKSIRQHDYEQTGLPAPVEWTPEQVKEKIEELIRKLQEVREQERKKERIASLEKNLQELAPKLQKSKEQHESWRMELGALPHLPKEENLKGYTELYYFLTYYKEWHHHHSEQKKGEAQKKKKEDDLSRTLEEVNGTFTKYNFKRTRDVENAEAGKKKMRDQENQRQKLEENINHHEKTQEDQEAEKHKKEEKLKALYGRLNLEDGDKDRVREYEEQLKAYQKAKEEAEVQKKSKDKLEKELRDHSLYPEHESKIQEMQRDQLEMERKGFEEKASELEGINEEITRINTKIEHALQENEIERALAEEDNALDELEDLYEENLSSIAGAILVEELREESQERDKPRVLQRATDLFARITNGAYRLDIGAGKGNEFRAQDTQRGETLTLEQLSTGTRVQLLFAVRLAFIEMEEENSSYKLPLLADELLGNSDDLRAQVIIDSLAQVSDGGRQIFYFTAQSDELAKWRSYVKKGKINASEYLLTGRKNEEISLPASSSIGPLNLINEEIPDPGEYSHQEYGEILGFPTFNLLTDEVDQLHLWYLIEDLDVLASCIRMQVNSWGQLKLFLESGAKVEGVDDSIFKEIEEKINLLREFQALYRQGRPKPINRRILEESEAVSDRKIDEVVDKLQECSYNPANLIQSLENKEVKRFSEEKREELKDYLKEEGFIPNQKPLEKDEIMVRLNGLLSQMDISDNEGDNFLNFLISNSVS